MMNNMTEIKIVTPVIQTGKGIDAINRDPNIKEPLIFAPPKATEEEIRRNIDEQVKFECVAKEGETMALPVEHFFAPGVYMRKMLIPAGVMLTGKIHRHECINVMLTGELTMATAEGTVTVVAPQTIISPPGTKRGAYIVKDTWWLNIHENPDNETDLAILEKRYTADSFEDWQENEQKTISNRIKGENLCLGEQ